MGVMMQAFYWDCPRLDKKEYQWWKYVQSRVPQLAEAGFTELWLPPVYKAANISGPSMGYDPYDYYDLGEFDQKGSIKTWFGSKAELLKLIDTAHNHDMQVIADMLINHNSGADAVEVNPITGQERWTKFEPKSGKFPRNWECFHPNNCECWDQGTFGELPDLSHRNPYVFAGVMELARWLDDGLYIMQRTGHGDQPWYTYSISIISAGTASGFLHAGRRPSLSRSPGGAVPTSAGPIPSFPTRMAGHSFLPRGVVMPFIFRKHHRSRSPHDKP